MIIIKKNIVSTILVGVLVVAVFVIGTLYFKVKTLEKDKGKQLTQQNEVTKVQAPGQPKIETADNVLPVAPDDHIRGDKTAQIALIEYSDFECPFCKRFHSTAQQVVDEYAGQVMWVYRHFPLVFHQNALLEAEASECAAELAGNEGFWKYADMIYERTASNGTSFTKEQLVELAVEQEIDKTQFSNCLQSGRHTQAIKDEMDAGAQAGVTGTPGNILLNTKTGATRLISGAVPFEELKKTIDEMLET